MSRKAEYVKDVEVIDPKTDDYINMEVWRDPGTGRLFALEAEFVDTGSGSASIIMKSPYSSFELSLDPV